MTTMSCHKACVLVFVFVVVSGGFCDAGLLPNPFDDARGWYFLPFEMPKLSDLWTDLPRQASNFIGRLIPQPIKDLLNFDPAPDWVPNPKDFEENEENLQGHDMSVASSNYNSRQKNDVDNEVEILEDEDVNSYEEKGNLHGVGRDVIRSITDQINVFTTGLDTNRTFFSGLLNGFKDTVKAIVPGTQWCGDGNIARTKKDLGFFYRTDSCCREHDNCSDYIEKDQMKYELYNKGLFTRSHCDCDKAFYNCLKKAEGMIAPQIGMAYFTVLGPQCFQKEHPIIGCRIRIGLTNRCINYELDTSKDKVFQWFDNPEF